MQTFFVVSATVAGIHTIVARKGFIDFFQMIAPLGRMLLLTMYFFGIFHKINSDFLNIDISCATALWKSFYLPSAFSQSLFMQYTAIYGTFLVEGFVLFSLITQKFGYLGIIIGVIFHTALGFNEFSNYGAFSSLAIALHTLFLPKEALTNFKLSRLGFEIANDKKFYNPLFLVLFFVFVSLQTLEITFNISSLSLLWWPIYSFPFIIFLGLLACSKTPKIAYPTFYFFPSNFPMRLLAILFFINCSTPYLGLKTSQSINMFSNLRLEERQSNHLLLRYPPAPFKYLEDTVEVIDSSDFNLDAENYRLVYYEFLSLIADSDIKKGTVTYKRNGILYKDISYETLKYEIDKNLHPLGFEKYSALFL